MSKTLLSCNSSFEWPGFASSQISSGYSNTGVIDAAGEKVAMVGKVWFPARTGSKNISRVHFRFGTITKSNGSTLTVSLQDVSLTSGPTAVPDETQDQTVNIANADANFASNTWYRSATLSAERTVSIGDLLAVVFEYNSFVAGDSVIIQGFTSLKGAGASFVLKSGGTWSATALSGVPILVLEFSDGSFGILDGSVPYNAAAVTTFNVNTATADEYGNIFRVPVECEIDAIVGQFHGSLGTSDYEICLYTGTTLVTGFPVAFDANTQKGTSAHWRIIPIPKLTLSAGVDYYLTIRPTTADNANVQYFEVYDANIFNITEGDTTCYSCRRLNQGSWDVAFAPLRRYAIGVRICSIETGGGGGNSIIGSGIIRALEAL